jgi:alginate biosynthesis protein AlgX
MKRLACLVIFMLGFVLAQTPEWWCEAASTEKKLVLGKEDWVFEPYELERTYKLSVQDEALLRDLSEALKSQGITMLVVPLPSRPLVYEQYLPDDITLKDKQTRAAFQDYLETFADLGFMTVNVFDSIATHPEPFFFKRDHHWTPEGSRMTAEAVAEQLRQVAGSALPEMQFELKQTGERPYLDVAEVIGKSCDSSVPPEILYRYELTQQNPPGLLEEVQEPGLAVLGTSMQRSYFHFADFLSYALNTDVVDVGVEGGGNVGSLDEYFRISPPHPFLVWEFEAGPFSERDRGAFAQIIPGVFGVCEESVAQGQGTLALGAGGIIDVSNYYLHLSFADPSVETFTVRLGYADNTISEQEVTRVRRTKADGTFFIALDAGSFSPLVSIDILPPEGFAGNLETRLCSVPESVKHSSGLQNANFIAEAQPEFTQVSGFTSPERQEFRWALGPEATLTFLLEQPRTLDLTFEMSLPIKNAGVTLLLNGQPVETYRGENRVSRTVTINAEAGANTLSFVFEAWNQQSPEVTFAGKDGRLLAAKFSVLSLD